MSWISVEDRLPQRAKWVHVRIDGKEHKATLIHNDWHFSEETCERLGVRNMRHKWEIANKITHWRPWCGDDIHEKD